MKKTYKRKRKNVKKYTKRTKKRSNKRNNRRNYKKTYKRSNRKYFKKVKGGKPRVNGCQEDWKVMDDVKNFLRPLERVVDDGYIPVTLFPELTENPVYYGSVDFTNSAVLFESVVEIFKEKGLDLDTRSENRAENAIQFMKKVEPKNVEELEYVIRWRQSMFSSERGVRAKGENYWYYGRDPSYPFTTEDKKFNDFKHRIENMFLRNNFNEYFFIVSHGTWMKVFHRRLKILKDGNLPLISDDIMIEYITEDKQEYGNLEHMYFRITKTSQRSLQAELEALDFADLKERAEAEGVDDITLVEVESLTDHKARKDAIIRAILDSSKITKHFIIVRHCRACHNTMATMSLDGARTKASRLNFGTFSKCLIMPVSAEDDEARGLYETAKDRIISEMISNTDIQSYDKTWAMGAGLTYWKIGCSPIFRALLTCYNFCKYGLVGGEKTRKKSIDTEGVSTKYAARAALSNSLNRSVETAPPKDDWESAVD